MASQGGGRGAEACRGPVCRMGKERYREAGGATVLAVPVWLTVEPRATGCGRTLEQCPVWAVGGSGPE